MRKKAFAACFISVLLICASIGAWVVYHHARPGTSLLEFEYGDALQIDEKALIRTPDQRIYDTVTVDLSAVQSEEGIAAIGTWDAAFTYTDIFGTHTCPLRIRIQDTTAPSFLKLPERITLSLGESDHDFRKDIEIWDLSTCELQIDAEQVDFDAPGEYIFFVSATDAYGNARTRSIRVDISDTLVSPAVSHTVKSGIDPSLQRMIERYLDEHAGAQEHWSVMVMRADSEEAIVSVDSAVQQSASLMKLFVMGAVYDRYASLSAAYGSTVLDDLLTRMITVSDNDAWIELVTMLGNGDYGAGCSELCTWCEQHGYSDTAMYPDYYQNFTSVQDTTCFLRDLCHNDLPYSQTMLALLQQQQFTWKIPAGIPDDIVTANKTGELADTENDAAIIYAPQGTYIMSVMATGLNDTETAQQMIRELSAMVYDFLNA